MSKMILIEEATVQQALDALDIAQGMLADLRSRHQPKMLAAYTAMREALAAPQPAQPEQKSIAALLLQSKQNFETNFGPHWQADWVYSDLLELLDDEPAQPIRGLQDVHDAVTADPSIADSQPAQPAQPVAELAEADRRAGEAERKLAGLRDELACLKRARDKMKDQWGVDCNVSFDAVWTEALELKRKSQRQSLST